MVEIPADQRFFLGTRPPLELRFPDARFGESGVEFNSQHTHGSIPSSCSARLPCSMIVKPLRQVSGHTNVNDARLKPEEIDRRHAPRQVRDHSSRFGDQCGHLVHVYWPRETLANKMQIMSPSTSEARRMAPESYSEAKRTPNRGRRLDKSRQPWRAPSTGSGPFAARQSRIVLFLPLESVCRPQAMSKRSASNGCPGRDRTYDQVINSHLLCH